MKNIWIIEGFLNMVRIQSQEFTTLIDETSVPNVSFIGRANVAKNCAPDEKIWQIFKVDESSSVTKILYADGDIRFNKKWSERTTLTYTTVI